MKIIILQYYCDNEWMMHVKSTLHTLQLISINLLFLLSRFILKSPWYPASCPGCRAKASMPYLKQPPPNSWLVRNPKDSWSCKANSCPSHHFLQGQRKHEHALTWDQHGWTPIKRVQLGELTTWWMPSTGRWESLKLWGLKKLGGATHSIRVFPPQTPPNIHRKNWKKTWEIFFFFGVDLKEGNRSGHVRGARKSI